MSKKYSKPKSRGQKSAELGMDELQEMISDAVGESVAKAMKNAEEDAFNKSRKDGDGDELTADIESVIADAVEAYNDDVKSRKDEAGDEWTEDDEVAAAEGLAPAIADAVAEALSDEVKEDDAESDDETKDDEGQSDEEEKRRKALNSTIKRAVKSAIRGSSATYGRTSTQRKYADIYMGRRSNMAYKSEKKADPKIQLARAIKCLDVFGRHDPEAAAYYAKKNYDDSSMAREFKALSATNPTEGGYLIPEIYMDEIIEILYAKTVLYELGARKVPMPNGNLNVPKMTSGARATWGGEARKIAKTQPAFGNIKLSAKRLEAIVPQTRELLMSTSYSADEMFATDLTRRMELGLDYGGMFGTGGEFQPLGIFKNKDIDKVNVSEITDASLSANGKITADFPIYLTSLALEKNIDDASLGWTFNSLLEGYLKNMKTSTGAYIYREEMNTGKFCGFNYKVSNQIPTTNGNTGLIFGNFADLMIGEQLGLETFTTLEGSWVDENGVQHNAFEENLAATRALMFLDIGVRHAESFICATDIKVK